MPFWAVLCASVTALSGAPPFEPALIRAPRVVLPGLMLLMLIVDVSTVMPAISTTWADRDGVRAMRATAWIGNRMRLGTAGSVVRAGERFAQDSGCDRRGHPTPGVARPCAAP